MKDMPKTELFNTFAIKGMELRDYFAAKAMQAIITRCDEKSSEIEHIDTWVGDYAYTVADAMMEARNG